MEFDSDFFSKFIHNMGEFFGEKCEIVVHDYRSGYDHTITEIVNGEVSGRSIGGCPSSEFIERLEKDDEEIEHNPIYFIKHTKGKIIKCCSTLVRDKDGKTIGVVCINLDISDFIVSQNVISNFIKYSPHEIIESDAEILVKSVDELMDYFIRTAEKTIGKPVSLMNRDEKIKALAYLNSKGIFKIAKANVVLCEALQISKFTLYNYLEEGKKIYGNQNVE